MIWRVEVRLPAGEGEWELWGRHPSELEANVQRDDYEVAHLEGEALVVIESTELQRSETVKAR